MTRSLGTNSEQPFISDAIVTRPRAGQRSLWLLASIVALYVALGIYYIVIIPPFEGPDEPHHFAYVTWLIRHNTFPPQDERAAGSGVEHESSQHPFYYLLASLPGRLVNLDDPPIVFRPNPHFIGPLDRTYADNDNRAIHHAGDLRPLAGGRLAFYMARGVTMLFGALLVGAVYGLSREIRPGETRFATLCALLVAVIPQTIFLGAVVSNDMPVAAMGACALWALARLLRRGNSARRATVLGAAVGLAVLTKASALALLLPVGVGLLWLKRQSRQTGAQFLTMSLLVAGSAFLVAGWWFVRGWLLFGSPLGLETHAATTWAIVDPADVERFGRRWWEVFRSFWLWFGWGTLRADPYFYTLMAALSLVALGGLGRCVWRSYTKERSRQTPPGGGIMLVLSGLAVLSVALMLELWMRQVIAPFGRLLYPALSAVVVLLVAGWLPLHRRLPLAVIGFLLLVAILAPVMVLQPAYARPHSLPAEEAAQLEPSLGLRFGSSYEAAFAELLDVRVLEKSVAAGNVAPVRVCWRTLGAAARDYSLFLHVIGPQDSLIAGRRTYPGLGAYPTSQWQAGELFCDRVQIEILEDAPIRPLAYQVEVGMIDAQTGERLPIFDAHGERWPVAFVGRLRVYSGARLVTVAPDALEGTGSLRLVQGDVTTRTWRPGERQALTLVWTAAEPPDIDYQTYVHLREPGEAAPVAQADGPPLDGWYPTSWWTAGEIVVDERYFDLPQDVGEGMYELYVGMYHLESNERVGAEHALGQIVVQR